MYSGSCLCGDVQFVIRGDIHDVIYCHCVQCRKSSGSAFLAFGSAKISEFSITKGAGLLVEFASSAAATRSFCQQCGATMFWAEKSDYGRDNICFTLGSLDTPFEPKQWQHFHVGGKASWYAITDAMPQFLTTP